MLSNTARLTQTAESSFGQSAQSRAGRLAALLAGVLAACTQVALYGVSPVGHELADWIWTAAMGLVAGLAIARAPLWAVAGAGLLALGFVAPSIGIAAALCALLVVVTLVGQTGWSGSVSSASFQNCFVAITANGVAAGGLVTAALSLQDRGLPFASAGVAIVIWSIVIVTAISQLSKRSRSLVMGGFSLTVVASGVLLAVAALDLQNALNSASASEKHLRQGLTEARSGELEAATDSLSLAIGAFESATEPLSSPSVVALKYVPIAGPNLTAAESALHPAGNVIALAQDSLDQTGGLDNLLSDEGIAVEQVVSLAATAETLIAETRQLRATLEQEPNTWVLNRLQDRIDSVALRVADMESVPEVALADGVQRLLGAEAPRSYLVLFGNTAEARELGGFTGGTALVSLDNGRLSLESANRPLILNEREANPHVFTTPVPQRFLEHRPWLFSQNYSAMADFPTLAHALRDLYPHMGGHDIDGVIYIDPQTLATLVGLVGEIELESNGVTVNAENVARLVTIDQYSLDFEDRPEREEFLADLAASIFAAISNPDQDLDLSGASSLVDSVRQDRLLFVPFDEEEFELAEAMGLTGQIPEPVGQDYIAVSHLNGGPNKLDAYMHREVSYVADVDPATGEVEATVEVVLTNNAPAGLAQYASRNNHEYADTTNRAFLVVHTPHDVVRWTGGDEPELTRSWQEFGWQRHEHVVAVPRGQSRTVVLQLSGQISPGDYTLDIGHQPLVHNDSFELHVTPETGTFSSQDQRFSLESDGLSGEFTLTQDTQVNALWNAR